MPTGDDKTPSLDASIQSLIQIRDLLRESKLINEQYVNAVSALRVLSIRRTKLHTQASNALSEADIERCEAEFNALSQEMSSTRMKISLLRERKEESLATAKEKIDPLLRNVEAARDFALPALRNLTADYKRFVEDKLTTSLASSRATLKQMRVSDKDRSKKSREAIARFAAAHGFSDE